MEMEKDASNSSDPKSSSGSTTTFSTSPPPSRVGVHSPPPVRSSSTTHSQKHQFSTNFTKLYHSIFSPTSPSKKSTPVSPQKALYLQQSSPDKSASSSESHQNSSGICSNSSTTADADQKLEHACLVLEYQNLQNRYNLCRSHLQDLTNEINALRRENTSLRLAKTELVKLLSLSSQATMHDCLRRLSHLDLDSGSDFAGDDGYSPTSVVEQSRLERTEPDRVWLPKSISVRSSSYLKANQLAANNSGPSRTAQLRASSELETGKQRMYLPGAKKEFEVYSQGTFKTELCNKWQESGTCPYGDHCQFAHGIAELRPVIRHPRYKTEVCRMVLAGDSCPYGHRCHFRHSLTEQEMMLANPR